jgi:hypothetical protein
MLIACNIYDVIHGGDYYDYTTADIDDDYTLFIVDTDDYVMESISAKKLKYYMKKEMETGKGLQVDNVGYDVQDKVLYLSEDLYDFMECLRNSDTVTSKTIKNSKGITFKYIQDNTDANNDSVILSFDKGNKYKIHLDHKAGKGFQFKVNNILICDAPETVDGEQCNFSWSINYAVMLKGYFLVFTVLIDEFSSNLPTCVVLGFKDSKLTDIIFDEGDYGVNDWLEHLNTSYSTKECKAVVDFINTKMKIVAE